MVHKSELDYNLTQNIFDQIRVVAMSTAITRLGFYVVVCLFVQTISPIQEVSVAGHQKSVEENCRSAELVNDRTL